MILYMGGGSLEFFCPSSVSPGVRCASRIQECVGDGGAGEGGLSSGGGAGLVSGKGADGVGPADGGGIGAGIGSGGGAGGDAGVGDDSASSPLGSAPVPKISS